MLCELRRSTNGTFFEDERFLVKFGFHQKLVIDDTKVHY